MINLLKLLIEALISVLEWIEHTICEDSDDYTSSHVSTYPLSEYWNRIEKAHLEILQDRVQEEKEPITLWWGLKGVRVVDDQVVWVDRPLLPKDKDYSQLPYYSHFNPPPSIGLYGIYLQYGHESAQSTSIYTQMNLIDQQINQCCCISSNSYSEMLNAVNQISRLQY